MKRFKKLALILCLLSCLMFVVPTSIVHASPVSTVESGSSSGMRTAYVIQRKNFYADSYHWQFYADGTNTYYEISSDGSTWINKTQIIAGINVCWKFSVFYDGTYVYFVALDEGSPSTISYKLGSISGSPPSISWDTEETFTPRGIANSRAFQPCIVADSNGVPFIGYYGHTGAVADGFWVSNRTGASSWSHIQVSDSDADVYGTLAALETGGQVYALYKGSGITDIEGKLWNGTAWETEETCSDPLATGIGLSATNIGDDVLLAYVTSTSLIRYNRRDGSWGIVETITSTNADTDSHPSISTDGTSVWVFWEYDNVIRYKKRDGSWGSEQTLVSGETTTWGGGINAFYNAYTYRMGVCWTKDDGVTYDVRYEFFLTDVDEPTYSEIGHTSGLVGQTCYFYCMVSDNFELSGYYLSTNNSGIWTNETWTTLSGTQDIANKSLTLNSTIDMVLGFRFYVSDGADNWLTTIIASFTIEEAATPYIYARFTFNISNPEPNEAIEFDGSSSNSSETITDYDWDFGDGNMDSGTTVTHSYTTESTFSINLTVTSAAGTDTFIQNITVETPISYILARFTWNISNPDANQTILFNATWSESNENITSYDWDWGDGTPNGSGATPTHSFSSNGTYSIQLNVTSVAGTDSFTEVITVGGGAAPSTPTYTSAILIVAGLILVPCAVVLVLGVKRWI